MDKGAGHAFISYVREDSREVDRLQRLLESAGIRVWRDTADLWPGEDWRAEIRRAITEKALAFIACFSHNSVEREKSYQREELFLAIDQLRLRRPDVPWLIPVRFDDCLIPAHDIGAGRTLTSLQRVDLFGPHFDEAARRLVTTVMRILGRRSNVSSAVPARTAVRPSHAGVLSSGAINPRSVVSPGDIVYERAIRSGGTRICIRYADGAIAALSMGGKLNDTEPDVSPADSRIAFVRGAELWVMNPDGTENALLADFSTIGAGYAPAMPRWSPDGDRLSFELRRGDVYDYQWIDSRWPADLRVLREEFKRKSSRGESNICVIDLDGAGISQLTNDNASYGPASWSPSGDQLVFSRAGGAIWRALCIVNSDGRGARGSEEVLDASPVDESYPEWSPDGSRIYYRSLRRYVGAFDLAYEYHQSRGRFRGTKPRIGHMLRPQPPPSEGFSPPRVSADGSRVLFGCGKVYSGHIGSGGLMLLMDGFNPAFVKAEWSGD